uniref:Uncharacterized protein n=1 Tax=Octopus bimaculoides TaxID=37653 RepID=A0A0L8G5T9_OCTBM
MKDLPCMISRNLGLDLCWNERKENDVQNVPPHQMLQCLHDTKSLKLLNFLSFFFQIACFFQTFV